jgi:hypothetical protein
MFLCLRQNGAMVPMIALVGVLALARCGTVSAADTQPPDWKGGGIGTTQPSSDGITDVDAFGGRSSLVGGFKAEGFHVLDPFDFTFAGQATWTVSNKDTLSVTYTGQIFFTGDPDYPFGFVATLVADGGTGRLAGAQGCAVMTGAFTGIPGAFYFEFEGTLQPRGK